MYIAKDVVENSGVPTTNADKSRSVISTIVEHSRTKLSTMQDRKASYLHDYRNEHQVALPSAQTQEREARKSIFNMSNDDDDDDDIDDMKQTLTWIGFNTIASSRGRTDKTPN